MVKVNTVWEYSLTTEAHRIVHCAHQMVVGFYRANNFIVLPLSHPLSDLKTVTLPDFPYNQIPRFWETAKKTDIKILPIKTDKKTIDALVILLEKENIGKPDFKNIKKTWEKAESEIITEIQKIIPKSKIGKITIYPTVFGTTSSFNIVTKNPAEVFIYLREDQDIYTIVEAILSAITLHEVYQDLDGLWSESELLVDWLVTKSSISYLLKKYEPKRKFIPTLLTIRTKQSAGLLKVSDEFYRKLGVPISEKVFELKPNSVLINKKKPQDLTSKEEAVLKFLIINQNKVVSFDELGNILFTNENDFSLWAISKSVQRLRNKLEANGISGSYIQTLRGQGYLLKN